MRDLVYMEGNLMVCRENKGIAIRLSDRNSYGMSPRQIINEHYKFTDENKKPVYFSTNNKQDLRFKNRLDEMIIFFKQKQDLICVRAHIIKIEADITPFIPDDADNYAPLIFSGDARYSWYLIENLEVMDDIQLREYWYRNNATGELEPLSDVLKRPRFPKCYFEFKSSMDEESLLL